jgi:hypothetical protein
MISSLTSSFLTSNQVEGAEHYDELINSRIGILIGEEPDFERLKELGKVKDNDHTKIFPPKKTHGQKYQQKANYNNLPNILGISFVISSLAAAFLVRQVFTIYEAYKLGKNDQAKQELAFLKNGLQETPSAAGSSFKKNECLYVGLANKFISPLYGEEYTNLLHQQLELAHEIFKLKDEESSRVNKMLSIGSKIIALTSGILGVSGLIWKIKPLKYIGLGIGLITTLFIAIHYTTNSVKKWQRIYKIKEIRNRAKEIRNRAEDIKLKISQSSQRQFLDTEKSLYPDLIKNPEKEVENPLENGFLPLEEFKKKFGVKN